MMPGQFICPEQIKQKGPPRDGTSRGAARAELYREQAKAIRRENEGNK